MRPSGQNPIKLKPNLFFFFKNDWDIMIDEHQFSEATSMRAEIDLGAAK